MSKRRPYIGPSEAQANAEALARRGSPYAAASDQSFRVAWDWHRREPSDLREAVRMVRKAYSDEVPTKLHEGPDAIGPDGTPKMTSRAEGYIFGSPVATDAGKDPETGQPDLVGYYASPFRAKLDDMERGDESRRKHAAIVRHVTIGQQPAAQAAMLEGVPSWCASAVAFLALRSFLVNLTDIKVNLPHQALAETQTAA